MSILTLTEKNLKYKVIDYFQTIVNEMIIVKPVKTFILMLSVILGKIVWILKYMVK